MIIFAASGVNPWIKTPNIDRLAAKSVLFDRVFTASYPTIPHRTDVMTGHMPGKGMDRFTPGCLCVLMRLHCPVYWRRQVMATQLIHDTPHLVNGGHAFDWPFAAWSFVRGAEVDRPWIDEADLALCRIGRMIHCLIMLMMRKCLAAI